MAFSMTRSSPFPMVGVFFPLFGVLFVIFGIVQLIYNLKNTVSENRFTLLDITDAHREPDPLEKKFGKPNRDAGPSLEARLQKLDDLKTKGLITSAEHASKRKDLIDEI